MSFLSGKCYLHWLPLYLHTKGEEKNDIEKDMKTPASSNEIMTLPPSL